MPKKKGGGKKKKGGKKAKEPIDPKILERAMAKMPPPTPRGEQTPKFCVRVGELLQLKFISNPDGLVEHLKAVVVNPKQPELSGLDATNEHGWTCLMRAARDGMTKHVEKLLEAGADASVESLMDVTEKILKSGLHVPENCTAFPAGSTAFDLASLHHASLKGTASEVTDFNYRAIKEKLAEALEDDDLGASFSPVSLPHAERNALKKPSYHLVPQVTVAGAYYYEE